MLTPWEDADRKVAAVRSFAALPATWDGDVEDRIFEVLFDVLRHRRFHATELPAIKPTVAEILADRSRSRTPWRPTTPTTRSTATSRSSTAHEDVAELEALHRWAMVLHNQYPWDRTTPGSLRPGSSATTTTWWSSTPAAVRSRLHPPGTTDGAAPPPVATSGRRSR